MASQDMRTARTCAVLMIAVVAVVSISCGPRRVNLPSAVAPTDSAPLRVRTAGRVIEVPLEQYVLGAALSEVTPVGETAATVARVYEVQAVMARTYALAHRRRHAAEGFDLCDATHCQLYQPDRVRTSSFAAAADAAVARTRGQILRVGNLPIDALFHADCGGHTTTPAAAWNGTNQAYLPAREDRVPKLAHRTWTFDATEAEWRTLLNGDPRTSVGPVLRTMAVRSTGPGGRVMGLRLVGARERVVTAEVLRSVVTAARGDRSIMSTRFTIRRTSSGYRVVGSGFGHGVGLCQVGAIARARRGDSRAAILAHYFPGAQLR